MQLERKVERLSSLLALSSLVASQLDLDSLLQTVVNSARQFSKAAMSGLLVLSESHPTEYEGFWVSGWDTPPRHYPTGAGVFNLPLKTGRALRVENVPSHPESVGTPHGHPPIGPFLGVPLHAKGRVIGTLFVANLTAGIPFTPDDEEMLVAFAAMASVAIENARLYRQAEELAILRERERLAMDLHDTVAQIFFSIGLEADRLRDALPPADPTRERVERLRSLAAGGTAKVRAAIGELYDRGAIPGDANIYRMLNALVEEFKTEHHMQVGLLVTGPVDRVGDPVREVCYRCAHEALTNVHKHAGTDMAVVSLVISEQDVTLIVQDNGVGRSVVAPTATPAQFGLVALRRQVQRLGGELAVSDGDEGGTVLRVRLPLLPVRGIGGGGEVGAYPADRG